MYRKDVLEGNNASAEQYIQTLSLRALFFPRG